MNSTPDRPLDGVKIIDFSKREQPIYEQRKNYIKVKEDIRNKNFIFSQQLEAKKELTSSEQLLTEFYKKNPLPQGNPELRLVEGRLIRNVEEKQAFYTTLRQQYEIAKIEEVKENLLVNILDVAEPAVEISKPKKLLILIISLVIGGFVGITTILIQNLLLSGKKM